MSATPSPGPTTFYRRPLPDRLVAFSSAAGRAAFRQALDDGTMESYFALSEQFHTQADPAFCGLGSLVVVLNALGVDPGRLWKGPWRWFDESLLDCCIALDEVRARGVTMHELACLAECNGARARATFAAESSVEGLRRAVIASARASTGPMLIASYDRASLGQTGAGHFSPIAGYHAANDWALVLDVARFKYPPHWVALDDLFAAMLPVDASTNTSRGWIELSPGRTPRPVLVALRVPSAGWRGILDDIRTAVRDAGDVSSARAWVTAIAGSSLAADATTAATPTHGDVAPEHHAQVEAVLAEARASELFALAEAALRERPATAPRLRAEEVVVLALVLSGDMGVARGPSLAGEVAAIRRQLDALCEGGG